jgi:hypothetical protein
MQKAVFFWRIKPRQFSEGIIKNMDRQSFSSSEITTKLDYSPAHSRKVFLLIALFGDSSYVNFNRLLAGFYSFRKTPVTESL